MTITYNSLVAQVTGYLERSDSNTIAQIPNFIYQAEQRICRESKNIGFEVYVTGNFTPDVAVYQKPADWRRNITFNYGTGSGSNSRNSIQLRTYEYLVSYWPDRTQSGPPLFYSDYGYNQYLVAPTPDQAYPFEYGYLALPTPITVDNQTNWLTDYAPDILLYATLLESMGYLKNDERVSTWQEYYNRALASLNNQDAQRVEDRQSNRDSD